MPQNLHESRTRLLAAAEKLFMERGYKSVTLRDVADAIGIKHASIYYHAPGGKQQLFIEVIERTFEAHRIGITSAMGDGHANIRPALYAVADWLLHQPPMNMLRMTQSDMAELPIEEAIRIGKLAQASMFEPISTVLNAAQARGEIALVDSGLVAGGLLSMLAGLHGVPDIAFERPDSLWYRRTRTDMARELIDVFLNGLLPRVGSNSASP